MNSSSSKTGLVLAIIIFCAAAGLMSYEVFAIYREGAVANDLSAELGAGATGDQLVQDLKSLQLGHKDELDALDAVAVRQDTLVHFLDLAEAAGSAVGVKARVTSVTVDQNKSASTTESRVHVVVESDGDWPSSLAYTHALETLPFRVSIDNASLTTDLSVSGKHEWHNEMSLSLYSFK